MISPGFPAQYSTPNYGMEQSVANAPYVAASTPMASNPIALYPTGATALVPAPPTYEVIPHRIFVGGFPTSTPESELREHFEKFFPVKDVKIIKSLDGVSKGFGFVTFEDDKAVETVRSKIHPKQLEFRNRKLNIGPAIRRLSTSPFTSGYAIATPQGQIISAASPMMGSYGYTFQSPGSPMFIYPSPVTPCYPVTTVADMSATNGQYDQSQPQQQQFFPASADQTSPLVSPTMAGQQQFFVHSESTPPPVRSYANAVAAGGQGAGENGENLNKSNNNGGNQNTNHFQYPPQQNYGPSQQMSANVDRNGNRFYYSPHLNNGQQYQPQQCNPNEQDKQNYSNGQMNAALQYAHPQQNQPNVGTAPYPQAYSTNGYQYSPNSYYPYQAQGWYNPAASGYANMNPQYYEMPQYPVYGMAAYAGTDVQLENSHGYHNQHDPHHNNNYNRRHNSYNEHAPRDECHPTGKSHRGMTTPSKGRTEKRLWNNNVDHVGNKSRQTKANASPSDANNKGKGLKKSAVTSLVKKMKSLEVATPTSPKE